MATWKKTSDILVAGSMCAVLAVAGCGKSEPETLAYSRTPPKPGEGGGTLRIALESPSSLDPALVDDVYEATVVNQVFSGLVQLDANLNVIPEMAESWTISRDQRVFTFRLRDNAKFHNGRYVTAEDFVYSFTRLFDPGAVSPGIIQDYLGKIEGVEAFVSGEAPRISGIKAINSFTLEIRLENPYPSFLSVLSMDQAKAIPREVVEHLGAERFGREPVGSGPFRFHRWQPQKEICLIRNPDYFGTPAHLDTLRFIQGPEEGVEWKIPALHDRKLDFVAVREDQLPGIQERGTYRVMRRPELSVEFLGFNVKHPVFKDVRVRRAVAMAVDREALQRMGGKGFDIAAGILPPGIPGYSPESKAFPRDVEKARRLLAEAGYTDGKPLRFPMMTVSQSAFGRAVDSVIVASLAEAGIEVELEKVSWKEYDRAITGRTATIMQLTWIADLPDPDSFLYTLFISGGASNLFGYSNPKVDALLEAGSHDPDQVGRLERYRQAERLILEDAPLIPLLNVITVFALHPDVRGVELSPFGLCSIPMERIWLDRDPRELHAEL